MGTVTINTDDTTSPATSSPSSSCCDVSSISKLIITDDHDTYRIALYYCYLPLDESGIATVVHFHSYFQHQLGGRIRIATEGLNGVLSGTRIDLEQYEAQLRTVLTTLSKDGNINDNPTSKPKWELDVKYCYLRTDLSIASQLFIHLSVQITDTVVGLFDKDVISIGESDEIEKNTAPDDILSKIYRCSNRRQNERQQSVKSVNEERHLEVIRSIYESSFTREQLLVAVDTAAPHLSPNDWNNKLEQLVLQQQQQQQTSLANARHQKPNSIVLLDCRNSYESAIGYFDVPGVTTILTNTRKYSELPLVLLNQLSNDCQTTTTLRNASHIFMYCTGGVRCERASVFLQAALTSSLVEKENQSDDDANNNDNMEHQFQSNLSLTTSNKQQLPEIYQLHGGIQRYLEQYHDTVNSTTGSCNNNKNENMDHTKEGLTSCYYKGKNFVFDLRRTDPMTLKSDNVSTDTNVVGRCLVCSIPHDDYDNGFAPMLRKETRCYKCRTLILVCPHCRWDVLCWGDHQSDNDVPSNAVEPSSSLILRRSTGCGVVAKKKLYCGGLEPKECLCVLPVKEITSTKME